MPPGDAAGAPPIVQYWHSEEIPADVAELIDTFREQNPEMRHMLFCEAKAEEFIAEHLTAREVAAFRACAVPAMQADYFRYCAGYALGGIYADVDMRCLRELRPLLDLADGVLFMVEHEQVMNGFFVLRNPGHALSRLALEVATVGIEQRASQDIWALTGPWIFSALAAIHDLGSARSARDMVRRKFAEHGLTPPPETVFQVTSDQACVVEAFENVCVMPQGTSKHWVQHLRPEYKHSKDHWQKRQRRAMIFES
jgi:mannosyltransferase OCH1-like enzyme